MAKKQTIKPKYITPAIFSRVHQAVSESLGIDSQFDDVNFKEETEFGASSGGGRVIKTVYEVLYLGSTRGTYSCTVDLNQAEDFARIQWPIKIK